MTTFVQLLIGGIAQGCIYALVALSFVLIYKSSEVISLAQGDLLMVGAFGGYVGLTLLGFPYLLAAAGAVASVALLGMLLERLVVRPVLGQPVFTVLMVTIGIGFVLRGLVTMIPVVGTETHVLKVPYKDRTLDAGVVVDVEQLVAVICTLLLCASLYALFRFTRIGIAMQATSQNQLGASYMGIPVRRLNGLSWGLAAGVAAVAGLLVAPITFVHANMGMISLKALPAAVLGGLGSLPGAVVGGLIVGIAEVLSGFYLPAGFKDATPHLILLLILFLRPTGLFGEKARKKV